MDKKAQVHISNLTGLVLTVVLATVFLSVGLIVMEKFHDQAQTATSSTVNNLTMPSLNGTLFTIPEAVYPYFTSMTTTVVVVNGTGVDDNYIIIESGNYTTTSTGTIIIATGATHNYSSTNITYVWNYRLTKGIGTDINKTIEGIGNFGSDWITIIITVIAAAVIIGLLATFLTRRRT